ncbi:MAG: uroporphyrinogen decarboxylase [Planctomycetes bacterium]|nr:uroporphyrinogen decarboxylase [Planctomycetota bacterium]
MKNDRFLKACRSEPVDCTPIWMMRQAGRYIPEYKKLREKYDFMTLSEDPELITEVTLMPLKQFDFDAAIIFADIMTPIKQTGIKFELQENIGPVIASPIRTKSDVEKIVIPSPQEISPPLYSAIKLVKQELSGKIPLIGFAGAPFTLASYLIEGRGSRSFTNTITLMKENSVAWTLLMEKLTEVIISYLNEQINAGADAFQLFDSWVGCMSLNDYKKYVFPYSQQIFKSLKQAPSIHFGTETAPLLPVMKEAGSRVISVDWRIELDKAWEIIGHNLAIQGNLNPSILLGSVEQVKLSTTDILKRAAGRPGHIFNLGHGILPETLLENVEAVIETVHNYRQNMEYGI